MSVLYSILAFVFLLGIIVVVHEWGHYIAARLMGVRVEVFSFGFGKRLWGKQMGDTDFRVSLIPLGGYVKMAGEEEWDPDDLKPDEFQAKNRGQKMFILIMGPLMNLLLAFIILTIINITGVKTQAYKTEVPRIGYVIKGSAAEAVDIRKDDLVLSINGKPVPNWDYLDTAVVTNPNEKLQIEIERAGQVLKKELDIKANKEIHIGEAGLHWGFSSRIESFSEGSPAANAGLEIGDIILAINGNPITYFDLNDQVGKSEGKSLTIKVRRNEEEPEFDVVPKKNFRLESPPLETEKEAREMLENVRKALPDLEFDSFPEQGKYKIFSKIFDTVEEAQTYLKPALQLPLTVGTQWVIGITRRPYSGIIEKNYGVFPAMGKSVNDLIRITGLVFTAIKKMIVGKLSPKNLSGPIEIAKFSGKALEGGLSNYFMLIAFISLQLGLINLLPIPALDGGHLMIYSIESIIRRDFSQRVKGILMNIGFLFLIVLMAFVILNDIAKNLPNGWSSLLPF